MNSNKAQQKGQKNVLKPIENKEEDNDLGRQKPQMKTMHGQIRHRGAVRDGDRDAVNAPDAMILADAPRLVGDRRGRIPQQGAPRYGFARG